MFAENWLGVSFWGVFGGVGAKGSSSRSPGPMRKSPPPLTEGFTTGALSLTNQAEASLSMDSTSCSRYLKFLPSDSCRVWEMLCNVRCSAKCKCRCRIQNWVHLTALAVHRTGEMTPAKPVGGGFSPSPDACPPASRWTVPPPPGILPQNVIWALWES